MKRLCSICARGGSKGVLGKNLREVLSKPIIAYTLEQALKSKLFDAVAVSSDSDDILKAAKKYGAHYLIKRPDELATDTAPKLPVIKHCAQEAEKLSGLVFDTFVDLDCTSPLRDIEDIENVVKLIEEGGLNNVVTAMHARRSPYFNLLELNEHGFVYLSKQLSKPIVRRQDAPVCYDMNASIYAWPREQFFALNSVINEGTKVFIMPEERSIDIDSDFDFEIVSFLLKKKYGNKI